MNEVKRRVLLWYVRRELKNLPTDPKGLSPKDSNRWDQLKKWEWSLKYVNTPIGQHDVTSVPISVFYTKGPNAGNPTPEQWVWTKANSKDWPNLPEVEFNRDSRSNELKSWTIKYTKPDGEVDWATISDEEYQSRREEAGMPRRPWSLESSVNNEWDLKDDAWRKERGLPLKFEEEN